MSFSYLLRRLLYTILLMFIVVTLNFFLPRIVPGDPAERFYQDPRLSPEARETIKAQFGLDQSLSRQYQVYLLNLIKGDLGYSFTFRRPVLEIILSRIPWTLALTATSMLFSVSLGIVLGALAAWWRGGKLDTSLLALAIIFAAIPNFWFALMLILFFAFSIPIFPPFGMVASHVNIGFNWVFFKSVAQHAFLPVFTMSIMGMVSYAVLIRNSMIENINADYVRTAKSKGLSSWKVLFRHAFRNALLPLTTRVAMGLATLIGGAVIIETIFSWEGMGLLIVEASRALDYPLMQATMLILAALTITGNFIADIVYVRLDPRVQFK